MKRMRVFGEAVSMSSAYSAVRVGKLRLKGSGSAALKGKKRRKRKREDQGDVNKEDLRHGVLSE